MKVLLVLLAVVGSAQTLKLQVETESRSFSCSQPGSATILGSVVEAGSQRFVLDQCLPTQDCQKVVPAVFSLSAPRFIGFQRYLAKNGFVRVHLDIRTIGRVCEERLLVSAMGKWLGAPNPTGEADRFYFASGAQTTRTFPDSAFTIERCPQGKHLLRLRSRAGHAHDATPGESLWQVSDREKWTVNLLTLGSCNSDSTWSYWIADAVN